MYRKHAVLLVVPVVILVMAPLPAARGAETPAPAVECVSPEAVVVLNVAKPKAVLDMALRPKLVEAVKSSAVYKDAAAKPDFGPVKFIVNFAERQFKTNWQTVLGRGVGGGVTWALGPGGSSLLIVDALDADVPGAFHDLAMLLTGGASKDAKAISTTYGGVTIWSLGPKVAHAVVGKRVMVANSVNVIKAALDRRGRKGKSVASLAAYKQAVKAAGADPVALLYVNAAVVKKLPQVAKALAAETNPLLALLAAPVTEAFGKSSWAAISLRIKGDALTIDAVSDGAVDSSGVAKFALATKPGDAAMPNLAVPRRIAAMSLHRDLAGFYAAKDTLFPERTSGLIFFENMMGIFFTGRDLTSEVLAEIGPKARLVVAEQKYSAAAVGTPAVQFPAFALVLPMKNPKRFTPVIEEAWQKAVGLVNFTRGQQAEPGLLIDRPVHNGNKYTVAAFSPPTKKDKTAVDQRYNFRPALATASGHVILSSTDALAEDLMDALAKERAGSVKPLAATHSLIEIDGKQLASILTANRETMVRGNMVDKGNTRKQAETEHDTIVAVIKHVARTTVKFDAEKNRSKISLHFQLALPGPKRGGR